MKRLLWLLPPLLTGVLLRLWNLAGQILGGDELNAVRVALERPLREILITYEQKDHCIPLSVLYRAWMDLGLPASEAVFRLPVLLSGLAILLLFPQLAARRFDRRTAAAFAWLLALSPYLILYSRIVRSYMPVILLAGVAVAAFWAWRRQGKIAHAAIYVVGAALAVYTHLLAAPFVLVPFAFIAAEKLFAARISDRSWREIAFLATATVAALAAFILPSFDTLGPLILHKSQRGAPLGADTALEILQILAGSRFLLPAVIFWFAAGAGFVLLWRRQRRLAAYSLILPMAQLATILYLAPRAYDRPSHFARYLLIVLPVLLLWAAIGLAHPWLRGKRLQTALIALFLISLAFAGPMSDGPWRRSSVAHHRDYLELTRPRATLAPEDIPSFYDRLARTPGDETLLEFPWHHPWRLCNAAYIYQAHHGRPVLASAPDGLFRDPRLSLRNFVPPEPQAFLASRARYLVVHLAWGEEEQRVRSWRDPRNRPWRQPRPHWLEVGGAGPEMARRLEDLWGPPDEASDGLAVWDLGRLRAKG